MPARVRRSSVAEAIERKRQRLRPHTVAEASAQATRDRSFNEGGLVRQSFNEGGLVRQSFNEGGVMVN